MADISFAFLREGTSDNGLVAHIRSLLIEAGATSVIGAARSYEGTTAQKIAQVVEEPTAVDLIFVHRDSDTRDPLPRFAEISTAAAAHPGWVDRVVPVVPVRALEAWLLADEKAIREVVGKPSGKTPLNLPTAAHIETTAKPKAVLKAACATASGAAGARLHDVHIRFGRHRATLLERLEPSGPVNTLASWQAFVQATTSAAVTFLASEAARAAAEEAEA